MADFLKGAAAAVVVNILTVLGWGFGFGLWLPAVFNAGVAIGVLGYYGLEEKWGVPIGYWLVQLLGIAGFFAGFSQIAQLFMGQS